jgi:hypothetical protein
MKVKVFSHFAHPSEVETPITVNIKQLRVCHWNDGFFMGKSFFVVTY